MPVLRIMHVVFTWEAEGLLLEVALRPQKWQFSNRESLERRAESSESGRW